MRSMILVVGLALACGCGKQAPPTGALGTVEFEVKSAQVLSDAYRDDSAAADAKYKGKTGRVPLGTGFERDGKSARRFVPGGPVRSARQPDVVFRFASEAELARFDARKPENLV